MTTLYHGPLDGLQLDVHPSADQIEIAFELVRGEPEFNPTNSLDPARVRLAVYVRDVSSGLFVFSGWSDL